ncbi:hypothetical protein CL630_00795 [bacterium]|nr:hypothetical protein [bacterium]
MTITHRYSLADIVERESDGVVSVNLPIEVVNLLTQIRQSLEDIDELADSIYEKGQLAQGIAAALTPQQAQEYIRDINLVMGSKHALNELTKTVIDGEDYYVVLVAGHRRYMAVKNLVERKMSETKRFNGLYRVVLHFGLIASEALSVQFQENRHKQVPIHEEVAAARDFYRWKKLKDPKISIAQFARSIGRSASWVHTAMRFCTLPDSLQNLAGLKDIAVPYGILTEAARLNEELKKINKPMGEDELMKLVIDAVATRMRVRRFKIIISARIEHLRNGQATLFGDDMPEQRRPVRRVVAPELIRGLWQLLEYIRNLEALRQAGAFNGESYLDPETDPKTFAEFSPGSPINLTLKMIERLQGMVPHLKKLAAKEGGRNRKVLKDGEQALREIQGVFEELEEIEIVPLRNGAVKK